jgi:hypothetical protein
MKVYALLILFALFVVACGAEQLQEQLAEEAIGGNADVNISGSGDDLSVSVESDEGTFNVGSGSNKPESLTVPVPDGGEFTSSFEDASSASVGVMYAADRYDEIVAFYEAWTEGNGEGWQNSESVYEDVGGHAQRSRQWNSDGNEFFILVSDCIDIDTGEFTSVCVTINQNL